MANRNSDHVDIEIAKRVRALRLRRCMTQIDLSQALGVTFQQVQKYERGTNRISAGRLFRIAQVLDVPIGFFFTDLPGAPKEPPLSPVDFKFLQSAGAMRLIQAYAGIADPGVRRTLMKLAETLAGTEADGDVVATRGSDIARTPGEGIRIPSPHS
jgi:transcriptional regulator with XRE-family HTH domain